MIRAVICSTAILVVSASGESHADARTEWFRGIQSLLSSVKVVNKQTFVAGEKEAVMSTRAWQSYASSEIDRHLRVQIARTWAKYGPESQLSDPCYQTGIARATVGISERAERRAQEELRRIYQSDHKGNIKSDGISGWFGGTELAYKIPYTAMIQVKSSRHRQMYCSVSESAAGYCKLQANGMQSADTDYSMHTAAAVTHGFDQTEAMIDFTKNIAPVREVVKQGECSDVSCASALQRGRRSEASLAMARYTLLRIGEARRTQANGDAITRGGGL